MTVWKILSFVALINLASSTLCTSLTDGNNGDPKFVGVTISRNGSLSAVVPGTLKANLVNLSHCKPCVMLEHGPLSLHENDEVALEAIQILHWQMDDDMNEVIDRDESDEYLREELQYKQGCKKRLRNFHRNNDNHISVKELWTSWMNSHVHNWTTNQTVNWIATVVELPEYQEIFRQLQINGTYLPRIAVNHCHFLTVYLGMKDATSKLKLSLKAKDVVLFGTPRESCYHTKDAIFIVLVAVTIFLCVVFVYIRYLRMLDMKALIRSEQLLNKLKGELEQAKRDQELLRSQNANRFLNVKQIKDDADCEISEITKLQEQVNQLQAMLQKTEGELHLKCWIAPPELIYWLKVTYDLEMMEHSRKHDEAEKLLRKASNACEKLRKRRNRFINAFLPVNRCSKDDDVDLTLLNARTALEELCTQMSERKHRWHKMETLLNLSYDKEGNRNRNRLQSWKSVSTLSLQDK